MAVLERDVESHLDECVHQLQNVRSLGSCRSNLCISQLQRHLCHKQSEFSTDVCVFHHPYILKRASTFASDDDAVINMALCLQSGVVQVSQ